jgi:hypothetical protein
MTKGLSFESFAAECGVHFDTLYEWVKKNPEFSEAKKIGTSLSLKFWEKIGMDGVKGDLKNFNVAGWIFNMKNRFRWTDKVEVSGQTTVKPFIIDLGDRKIALGSKEEED